MRVTLEPPEEIARRAGSDGHQGICAEVSDFRYVEGEDLFAHEQALIVALDQVQDPQNLGAICRSAECAGAAGVVLPERRAAEVTPAVCKASAGAVEHLPLAQVRNLTDFLTAAKERGFWCYGADGGGQARLPPGRSRRTGGPGHGLGGTRAASARRIGLRCADLVAAARQDRVAQRRRSGCRAALCGGGQHGAELRR